MAEKTFMDDIKQLWEDIKNVGKSMVPLNEALLKEIYKLKEDKHIDQLTEKLLDLGKKEPGLALHITSLLFGKTDVFSSKRDEDAKKQDGIERYQPTNLEDLKAKIKDAVTKGKHIKAVGTRHSLEWTDIGKTNDIQIDMSQLQDVIHINRKVLIDKYKKELDEKMICCFEAGSTMKQVQEYLWPDSFRKTKFPERYRILPNQTGCVNLSLSGTITTGAHGNGLTKPIIADMVLSFCLLTVDKHGEVVKNQIEPSIGITDRAAFEKKYPGENLIQNNDIFRAALVNIGGMGIAYSYILRTEKAFYLKETRRIITWKEAKVEIPTLYNRTLTQKEGGSGSLHSFEIFVNPYPSVPKDEPDVVICTLEYSNHQPEGKRPDWHIIPHELVRLGFVLACDKMPNIVPVLLKILMWGTTKQEPVIMNAVEAMDPVSGLAVSGEVIVSECAMETQNADDVIEKIQALINLYQKIRSGDEHQFATCPFAVRFSSPTNAYMAMQYSRQSMMIISNILVGTHNAENTLEQFRDLMQHNFNARPHWGMKQDVNGSNVRLMYNENAVVDPVTAFTNVMQNLDPKGIFRNEFINRVFPPVQNPLDSGI